jgi:hypothetical protein
VKDVTRTGDLVMAQATRPTNSTDTHPVGETLTQVNSIVLLRQRCELSMQYGVRGCIDAAR